MRIEDREYARVVTKRRNNVTDRRHTLGKGIDVADSARSTDDGSGPGRGIIALLCHKSLVQSSANLLLLCELP